MEELPPDDGRTVREVNGLALVARLIGYGALFSLVGLVVYCHQVVGTPAHDSFDASWNSTFAAKMWGLATVATAGVGLLAIGIGVFSTRKGDDRSFVARLEVGPAVASVVAALGALGALAWLTG